MSSKAFLNIQPPLFSSSDSFDGDFDIELLSQYLLDDDRNLPKGFQPGNLSYFNDQDGDDGLYKYTKFFFIFKFTYTILVQMILVPTTWTVRNTKVKNLTKWGVEGNKPTSLSLVIWLILCCFP